MEIKYTNKNGEEIILTEREILQLEPQFERLRAENTLNFWLDMDFEDPECEEAKLKRWYENKATNEAKEHIIDALDNRLCNAIDGCLEAKIVYAVIASAVPTCNGKII